jgi:hypothetical protein
MIVVGDITATRSVVRWHALALYSLIFSFSHQRSELLGVPPIIEEVMLTITKLLGKCKFIMVGLGVIQRADWYYSPQYNWCADEYLQKGNAHNCKLILFPFLFEMADNPSCLYRNLWIE